MNYKPRGRGAHVVERITGDQGQRILAFGCRQYPDIVGPHNLSRHHSIPIFAVLRCQVDRVVLLNVLKRPEERVAMGRDPYVARLAREGGLFDVPRRVPQVALVHTLNDHHL